MDEPKLPSESLDKLLAAAEAEGVSPAALAAAAGLESRAFAAGIGYGELASLYEEAARLTGDEAFGLHVGVSTSPQMYGMIGYVAANSATFGESIEHLLAFQPLWSEAAGLELVRGRKRIRLIYWHHGKVAPSARRQESEQMLAALLALARTLVSPSVTPEEVRFEHEAPSDCYQLAAYFGCPLIFEAKATEILFAAELARSPIRSADPRLGLLLKGQAEAAIATMPRAGPFVERVRMLVEGAIRAGRPMSLTGIALLLSIGPRTLQRRLRDADISLRMLVNEVRMEVAKTLLADDDMPLALIAHRLGFSQTSAFHRAFARRTGSTPGRFRKDRQAAEKRR